MEIEVNYLAVIAAGIAAMALGAVWYGPLFGKQWMALTGISKEGMKSMPLSPMQAMGLGLVVALITAFVLSHIITLSNAFYGGEVSYMTGLSTAFWVWLGFVATTQIGVVLWEGKPMRLFLLNSSYSLVSLGIMGVILALWR